MQTQKRNQILPTWAILTLSALFASVVVAMLVKGQVSNLSWWGF